MEVGNITKAATFISFFPLSYKNTQLLFFVTVLFDIFMRQTLTDDFWGLHKIMNSAFPLICDEHKATLMNLKGRFFYLLFFFFFRSSRNKSTKLNELASQRNVVSH